MNTPYKPVDFDPFAQLKQDILVPTTEAQKEIWTSVKLGGDEANCAYNESVSLRLKGHLDYLSLIEALNSVVKRHDALRATFSKEGTSMIIKSDLLVELPLIDLTNVPDKITEEKEWLRKESETPFNLEEGPLIRLHVIRESQHEHLLVITAHHIICDGWSISIIMQDLAAYYNAAASGSAVKKEEAVQFSEYALREIKNLTGSEHHETEKFWLKQFEGITETLDLPIDKPRPALRTFHAKRLDVEFDMKVIDRIRQIGAKAGCSLVNTLTVAFEVFLYRISGCEDIVLGVPASGQSVTGMLDLVGHCVNLLPLRSKINPATGFINHLKSRKKEILDAFDHQQYTFGSLINRLGLPRDPSRIPLVPVIFNVDTGVFDGVKFNGLEVSFYSNPRSYENFEIFINAANYNGRFIVECTYNTDLFDEEIMHGRMLEFMELLAAIVNNPDTETGKLSILPSDERNRLLVEWIKTAAVYPKDKGIHHLIMEMAVARPDHEAITDSQGFLSYKQLEEKANILANHLLTLGAGSGKVVALCTDRNQDMVIALLAILKTGSAYLPLDPSFPKDRIQMMLDDAGVQILLSLKNHVAKLGLVAPVTFFLDEGWAELIKKISTTPEVVIHPNHLAYIIYTSGSTGRPKGVQVSHQSVLNLLSFFRKELAVMYDDNLLAVTTISFDIAGLELFLPLISGATLTIASKEEVNDAGRLIHILSARAITILQATPVTWRMLIGAGWTGSSSLKALCGGEAMPADLAGQLISRCKSVWNVYGPTETTIWSTSYRLNADLPILSSYVEIGKPIDNTEIYLLNSMLQPVPVGIAGELHIGGDGVSLGYLNRPELNAEKFIKSPFHANKLLYKTGDLARFKKDGNLDFINRIDNQVKVRGYRIELGEIESVLAGHPSIRSCIVITRKDKSGENRLIAYYILNKDENPSVEKIRQYLKEFLPEYMIPSAFVEMKSFPQTPNGKIDRKALPEPDIKAGLSGIFVPSRTPNENLLDSIWTDILGVEKISMNDDFFKLGGHSLLAVRLMMEIEKHRGIKLPIAILFSNSTIEKLARVMDREISTQVWHSIVPIKTGGRRPPLYFAHGVSGNVFKYHELSRLLPDDQPCYGLQAFGLNGKDTPFDNMQDMAAYHVKEILNFQPDGTSFSLAGGSFGGYLAFEMARQLHQMGKKVDLVALIDIDAATASEFLPFFQKHALNLAINVKRVYNRILHIVTADKAEREKYLTHKLKSLKPKKELDLWLNKEEIEKTGGLEQASYFNVIEEACYKALMNYKISDYKGKVVLFRAKSGYFSAKYSFDLGWNYYASDGVDVFEVPGDHNSIFNKGNVEEMAKIFAACLTEAQEKK